jgi:hypothetical protein
MTEDSLGRFALVAGTVAVLFTGCAQPNAGTAAGRSDIAGQQCTLCIAENPGDYDACRAVCVRRVEDESAYLKAIGR